MLLASTALVGGRGVVGAVSHLGVWGLVVLLVLVVLLAWGLSRRR